MPVYYDKKQKSWYAKFYYTDASGKSRQKMKRGFMTQYDAVKFEIDYKEHGDHSPNIPLKKFYDLYYNDASTRVKESTLINKNKIFETHIIPYFGEKMINSITPLDIRQWQNFIIKKANYSSAYLKAINVQLSAMFNFAVRFYGLKTNPCIKAGYIVVERRNEMKFWTNTEYLTFIGAFPDNSMAKLIFEILYWTGIREGELLALTLEDIDFSDKSITINKTFHRLYGTDYITSPKTPKSNRRIPMPDFLSVELHEYVNSRSLENKSGRLFPCGRTFLYEQMKKGCENTNIKRIRIHDLRHSHASLLINMGFPAAAIAERLGHERISTTLNIYSHFFPNQQDGLVKALDKIHREGNGD